MRLGIGTAVPLPVVYISIVHEQGANVMMLGIRNSHSALFGTV
ncbi:hypothetical protein KNP414_06974 [Paenibacillus mucilaginosus KNP414]|uniref:Uncharacterized protein n=1 Tax=Paenibacillus mucilaginosus (strain KNP414) TaxID=1036673 RepID=F8FIN2_PAEMK|nr:hypothetical protein KNP414_06974 [Paenibacillus mucilaginosus KNP414]